MANNSWLYDPSPEREFGIRMNEVLLEKARLAYRIPVDAQIRHDMDVNIQRDTMFSMADQILFEFQTTVFKEKLPPQSISKTVEFSKPVTVNMFQPRSPWQMWKRDHQQGRWVGWLVRKLPTPEYETLSQTKVVRHSEKVTVDLQHAVIYPKAKAIASPNMGGVAIRWVDTEWRE